MLLVQRWSCRWRYESPCRTLKKIHTHTHTHRQFSSSLASSIIYTGFILRHINGDSFTYEQRNPEFWSAEKQTNLLTNDRDLTFKIQQNHTHTRTHTQADWLNKTCGIFGEAELSSCQVTHHVLVLNKLFGARLVSIWWTLAKETLITTWLSRPLKVDSPDWLTDTHTHTQTGLGV